jgi:hypothetical protein
VNEKDEGNASLLFCDKSNEIILVKSLTIYMAEYGHLVATAANTTTPPSPGKAGSF